jgi:ParB family chromosome partitioning protein
VVRPNASGYELIAGERRWRAAQLAGLHEIPAVVRELPDQAAAAMSLIENIQREDLNPLEEAQALQRLIAEFGLTHQQTAEAVGRSRAAVSNLLRLLDLAPEVKALLQEGALEMGHARTLLALAPERQGAAAREVAARGYSVRETERYVQALLADGRRPKAAKKASDPDLQALELRLSEQLGAPVSIRSGAKGKGQLVVRYSSLEELDGILAHIK